VGALMVASTSIPLINLMELFSIDKFYAQLIGKKK
jgi:hypothetical protein